MPLMISDQILKNERLSPADKLILAKLQQDQVNGFCVISDMALSKYLFRTKCRIQQILKKLRTENCIELIDSHSNRKIKLL